MRQNDQRFETGHELASMETRKLQGKTCGTVGDLHLCGQCESELAQFTEVHEHCVARFQQRSVPTNTEVIEYFVLGRASNAQTLCEYVEDPKTNGDRSLMEEDWVVLRQALFQVIKEEEWIWRCIRSLQMLPRRLE